MLMLDTEKNRSERAGAQRHYSGLEEQQKVYQTHNHLIDDIMVMFQRLLTEYATPHPFNCNPEDM